MMDDDDGKQMSKVIRIDDALIKDHPGEMVRGTDVAVLNAMLDAEADLVEWLVHHNTERPHLGYRNVGRRPIETVMLFVSQEGYADSL
ncbi:hypothetical protein GCM10011316_36580 [Roseibium aquae]|uniref:Uncharacterized protein n=1 Tax=Roseibium aquae TaxID=1323746 RepID=A0A916X217_9HYPH|nr:transposase [Roseibium aquae]GGB61285.1 hypothetical protein GCM10011316_36580 [Roseibium aquae]